MLAALLTSFYSWRLMFLTFWGTPRWIQSEHIQHVVHKTPQTAEDSTGGYHPHESPLPMLVDVHLWSRLPASFHPEIERSYVVVQGGGSGES